MIRPIPAPPYRPPHSSFPTWRAYMSAARKPRLLAKLEVEDFDNLATLRQDIAGIDGLVYGHHGQYDLDWQTLTAPFKWDYFDILAHPRPEHVGQGNPWFDFVATLLPFVTLPDGTPAPTWTGTPLIAFDKLTQPQTTSFASTLTSLVRPGTAPFLDLWFPHPYDWMFPGADFAALDIDTRRWENNHFAISDILADRWPYAMSNGSRVDCPFVQYLERSGASWDYDMQRWSDNPDVFEINLDWPDHYNELALVKWLHGQRWLTCDRFDRRTYLRLCVLRSRARNTPMKAESR